MASEEHTVVGIASELPVEEAETAVLVEDSKNFHRNSLPLAEDPEDEGPFAPDVFRSECWYEDGNIVLIAECVAFRVHRGLLAQHSTIFHDLFSVPQPCTDASELIEGCPVVHLSDTSDDVERLLRALYDGPSAFKYGERLSFSSIAPLLELAHKYNIEALRDDMVLRMRTVFCHQFSVFKSSAEFIYSPEGYTERILRSTALEIVPSRDAIRSVELIRLIGETMMLPMAFYLCTLLPAATLISGSKLPNGRMAYLSPGDLAHCMEARVVLALRAYKARERISLFRGTETCVSSNAHGCGPGIESVFGSPRATRDVDNVSTHALTDWGKRIKRMAWLCKSCRTGLVEENNACQRHVWEKLPEDLGLVVPGWNAAVETAT
ncbi:hypothetical protein C8Q78DRAFT_978161 [Trametes maxima]|nr:hypothetical protein C8Q78DRAFT_978161 [Trametes maxima]